MALFAREPDDPDFERGDRGRGSFDDYRYDLRARNGRIRMTLAGSDGAQDEIRTVLEQDAEELATAISPRTIEQERVDARIAVRLFTGRRVSGVVGSIPRGLESVIDETLRRLDDAGTKPRIPAQIVQRRGRLRVELMLGAVR